MNDKQTKEFNIFMRNGEDYEGKGDGYLNQHSYEKASECYASAKQEYRKGFDFAKEHKDDDAKKKASTKAINAENKRQEAMLAGYSVNS